MKYHFLFLFICLRAFCFAQVGIGTSSPVTNSKLDIRGGGISIGGIGNLDATLHIKTSYGGYDRLTQMAPSAFSKPAFNIMASTNASGGNDTWFAWGVDYPNLWTIQPLPTPTSTFNVYPIGFFMKSDGKIGVGTRSPSYELEVNGSFLAAVTITPSDKELKNISETISSQDHISTIKYEWKDGRDDRVHIGYGAQDVENVLPDAVYTDQNGLKSVNYDEVHTYKLLQQEQLIKEMQHQIDELQKLVKHKRKIRG